MSIYHKVAGTNLPDSSPITNFEAGHLGSDAYDMTNNFVTRDEGLGIVFQVTIG